MNAPLLYMIAGANGAGKTTAALSLLPDFLSVYEFVNADEIARGLNPLNPEGQAMAAGRIMLERMDKLIAAHKNFAFETTGASRIFEARMHTARAAGYRLGLVYLWLPSPAFAKSRVRIRVAQGGHAVADKDIERRYVRGLKNILNVYLPLVDEASIIDNTETLDAAQSLIAEKINNGLQIYQADVWHQLIK